MGKDLMPVHPFAESIHKSKLTLKNLGMDLEKLLRANDSTIFENIHHALVAITSIQIALWDTLKEVLPSSIDGYVGYSHGELLCGYADGCLTAEETLLLTDARGRAIVETRKVIGAMASVGLSAEEVTRRLPAGVQLAGINSASNVTISGEAEAVTKFVQLLKSEDRFAVPVNACNVAMHASFVDESMELFAEYAAGIIPDSEKRLRSARWVSTLFSRNSNNVSQPWEDIACTEYFTHNYRLPVLFYQALQNVPQGSVVLEISPQRSLARTTKDTVPSDCVYIAPMESKVEDRLVHFYESVGKIFNAGLSINMSRLYPKVSVPVSANTPFISPLVRWEHEESWKTHIISYPLDSGYETIVDLNSPAHENIKGHRIQDRVLYPATGYIFHVWTHFAEILGKELESTAVVLRNVQLERATVLDEKCTTPTVLFSTLLSKSGTFELKHRDEIVMSGNIELMNDDSLNDGSIMHSTSCWEKKSSGSWLPLNTNDIYKEFRLRGYNYRGAFQGIQNIDNEGKWAEITWRGDWTTFLDSLLQTTLLPTPSRCLALPVAIEKIEVDPVKFLRHVGSLERSPTVRVEINHALGTVNCPGLHVKSVITTVTPRRNQQRGNLAFAAHVFCPTMDSGTLLKRSICIWEMIDLVLENNNFKQLQVFDVFTKTDRSAAEDFFKILRLTPCRQANIQLLTLPNQVEELGAEQKKLGNLVVKENTESLVPDVEADLVFLDNSRLLNAVVAQVKPFGFIVLQSDGEEEIGAQAYGLVPVSKKITENTVISLYRKVDTDGIQITHFPLNQEHHTDFQWVTELQDVLERTPNDGSNRIYVTSQGQATSGINGFVKCLLQEEGHDHVRCIFDPDSQLMDINFAQPCAMLQSIIEKDLVINAVEDGKIGTYRHVLMETKKPTKDVDHAYVTTLTPGDLSALQWVESPSSPYYPSQQVAKSEVYSIEYAAVNFRDILLATAVVPIPPNHRYNGPFMGYEFSGYDMEGKRVMGIGEVGMLATSGWTDPNFVWPVPEHWTLEEAATVPIVYSTVLYALHTRGSLQPGRRILIHAGTGGIGQAAINVALAQGCEIFTTVGSQEKRDFLKQRFPQIKDDHIGNSRDTSFEGQFLQVTNGRGVDVVVNSLEGEKLMASVRCLATNGTFIELGVYDAQKNTALGMRHFLKNLDFCGFDLLNVMTDNNFPEKLRKLIVDGIASGAVRPLPTHPFECYQLEEAFRFMSNGKHMGKLLIKTRAECTPRNDKRISALARTYFSRDKGYIIVGGLGGFGLEVANWMIERGAQNLILTSRSGVVNGYQSLCLRRWRTLMNANVETPAIDLSSREEAEAFIREVSEQRPIGGIFNCAMVLQDDAFRLQSCETFKKVSAPKASLTEHLDALSRQYCQDLDYFVGFSSIFGGRGNSEQTNYGWANSVMERICRKRMADGIHGLAIQWGVVGDVGFVAEKIQTAAAVSGI